MEELVKLTNLLGLVLDNGEDAVTFVGFAGFAFGFGLSGIYLLVRVGAHFFRQVVDISTD